MARGRRCRTPFAAARAPSSARWRSSTTSGARAYRSRWARPSAATTWTTSTAIARVVGEYGAVMWSLFFLVPTGRGRQEDMISPEEHERVFNWLYDLSKTAPFDVRTTAAQHYRRVVIQRRRQEADAVGERPARDRRRLQLRRRARPVEPRRQRRQRLRFRQPHRRRLPERLLAAFGRERARQALSPTSIATRRCSATCATTPG